MYRVLLRGALTGFTLCLLPWIAASSTSAQAEQVALQAVLTADEAASRERLAAKLDQRLGEAMTAARDPDKAWLAQLKSFYAARQGAPVWVSSSGWTARGNGAIGELALAADWGLAPEDFPVPALVTASPPSDDELAVAEIGLSRAVVKYAFHARGGRIDPSSLSLWLDRTPNDVYATAVMIDVISNPDAGAVLRSMHPQSEAFELLRQAYVAMRAEIANPKARDPSEWLRSGETIKIGMWHPDVLIIRKRLNVPGLSGYESQFDETLANTLDDHLSEAGVRVKWGRIDDKARSFFNRPPPAPNRNDLMTVLANMERWRWLPANLGATHIWNNLPEFMTRVFKDGEIIHEERIIIGQPDTQTPVFSNAMRQVVFQPEWGVPPSIKINDLLPKLQGGDYDVLDRRNMRILGLSGKELKPQRFNWDKVDIRDVGIYQRSGSGNPLGRVKFLFPNKHHVYMHDTNNRALFKHAERTFSHGCVRVRDPERFAKLVLGLDKGWDEEEVEALLDNWKKPNNKIELDSPIPVHNVYFTLIPGEGRTLVKLYDMYGHDKRVAQALSGVPAVRIAASDPARNQQRELEEAAPPMVRKANAAAAARAEADDE